MSYMTDREYLLARQYRGADNLNTRQGLHDRFSTNGYGWHRWVFDQLDLPPQSRILELGCGPAPLWVENLARVPAGWRVILSDFSPGMVEQARQNLGSSRHPFAFEVIDAQEIPFADGSCDGVIANHMLYHAPDRDKALSEMRRVLKPGGRLYVATNGRAHLREIWELIRAFDPHIELPDPELSFSLENGMAQLSPYFSQVERRRYEDALVVTEVEPLVDYILSMGLAKASLLGEKRARFADHVRREMDRQGAIRVTKDPGLFVAVG